MENIDGMTDTAWSCFVLSLMRSFLQSVVPTHLVAKQSRDAGFGGVAYGREVVTALQGKHQPPACQSHQLPGQVSEAWTGRKWQRRGGGKERRRAWDENRCWSSYFPFGYCSKENRGGEWWGEVEEKGDCIRGRSKNLTAQWIYGGALTLI